MASLATTTLSQAVTAGAQQWALASVSGVSTIQQTGATCVLFSDGEAVIVTAPPMGSSVNVQRGRLGSPVGAHAASTTVYLGTQDQFYQSDPVGVPPATLAVDPWINTVTGTVWTSSGGQWVIVSGGSDSFVSPTITGTVAGGATYTAITLTTPTLGVASATTINKVTITAPATGSTLTIPNGVTLTGPAASGTAMTLGNTETVTGVKTFGSAGAVGRLKVAGTTSGSTIIDATAVAGSGTVTLPTTGTLATLAGTETLTNKTLTSPIVNDPAGATSTGVMITKSGVIAEPDGDGTSTITIAVPAGAFIHNILVSAQALWTAGTSAALNVGDTADPDGYFAAVNVKATDLLVGEVLSTLDGDLWGGKNGAYLVAATGQRGPVTDNFGNYYAAGSNILFAVAKVGTGTAGRTAVSVTYSVGQVIAQT